MIRKLFILSVLFAITSVFVYVGGSTQQMSKTPINNYFTGIRNYKAIRQIKMEDEVLNLLQLDDYLFVDFQGMDAKITLYIGYYYSADKASAAHSPLICYPSQGWKIEEQLVERKVNILSNVVHYNEIVTSLGEQKELVLYWYQAAQDTNTKVFKNKINVAYNKLTNKGEQHAFVRITVPLTGEESVQSARKKAERFIFVFYPHFLEFITTQ